MEIPCNAFVLLFNSKVYSIKFNSKDMFEVSIDTRQFKMFCQCEAGLKGDPDATPLPTVLEVSVCSWFTSFTNLYGMYFLQTNTRFSSISNNILDLNI